MRKLKKVRTEKTNGLNCLWSTSSRHYAHFQEVRTEIKYMCTINLSPNEIICSSYNHHSKQVYNTQLHLRFETFFLVPKSIYIYGLLHWSVYRALYQKMMSHNPATGLDSWGSHSHCPSTVGSQDRGGVASPARRSPACPRKDFSDMIFEEWQSNCIFEEQQHALSEIWALSQENGLLQGNIQRVVWSCEKIGHPWGKCLVSVDRMNKGSGYKIKSFQSVQKKKL